LYSDGLIATWALLTTTSSWPSESPSHRFQRDETAGAGPRLDDHRLPPCLRELVRDNPRENRRRHRPVKAR
jgi:hypothetical protein